MPETLFSIFLGVGCNLDLKCLCILRPVLMVSVFVSSFLLPSPESLFIRNSMEMQMADTHYYQNIYLFSIVFSPHIFIKG